MLMRQSSAGTTALRLVRPTLATLATTAVQFAGSPVPALVVLPAACLEATRALARRAGNDGPSAADADAAIGPRARAALLLLWAGLPQLVPFLVSQVSVPVYITRAAIVGLPALYLLAAAFLGRLGTAARAALVSTAVVGSLWAQLLFFQRPAKEQWREVAALVDARARPGDVAVFDAAYGRRGFDHYSRTPLLRKVGLSHDVTTAEGAAEIAALPGVGRLWIVRFQRPPDAAAVARALGPSYRLAGSGALTGIELYLFEPAPRAAATTTW
jgi:hypothetical protein